MTLRCDLLAYGFCWAVWRYAGYSTEWPLEELAVVWVCTCMSFCRHTRSYLECWNTYAFYSLSVPSKNVSFWALTLRRVLYSKTCLKRNAIVPVFFFRSHRFPFYEGLCFNKTKYKKYDRLGLQWRNNLKNQNLTIFDSCCTVPFYRIYCNIGGLSVIVNPWFAKGCRSAT